MASSSFFSRFHAWLKTHKVFSGLSGLILFGLGILIPWYLSVLDRRDKFDGHYDLVIGQGGDAYKTQTEEIAQARQLILRRSLESGGGLQQDLKIASDWNALGSSAIAFWQPLLECGRTKECLPGSRGPEVCERITRLADGIADISELLRSMGQLANLGMGGDRYKEPNTEGIRYFIENICASDGNSAAAVFKARQSIHELVLRRAREEWSKISAAESTAQRNLERYDEAASEMDDVRLFQLRFRKVLEKVPGLVEFENTRAARQFRMQEAWASDFARAICDVQLGKATVSRIEKIPNLQLRVCYQNDLVATCDWTNFNEGLQDKGFASGRDLSEVIKRTMQLCHPALPTSKREQTVQDYNEPAFGSFCENRNVTYFVESNIAYVTDQCGAWTNLRILRALGPSK